MNSESIKEMINSSDIECKYLAVSMLRYGDIKMSNKEKVSLIKKVNVIDRIKTIDDIYSELSIKEEDVLIFKSPKSKFERYMNACAIIPKISEVLNEGTIFDFNDITQYKYFPYFRKKVSGWLVYSSSDFGYAAALGSGFYLKTQELALFAGEKFLNYYIDYLPE